MNKKENKTKVMVLGFDGSSFNVINELISKGKLPHFAALMKEGAWGKLRSTVPPLSGPAWATFSTGKQPGRHGIYDFFRNLPGEYACTPINSSFIPGKTFWETLSEQGRKVGIINMLFTYPPSEVNGFIVAGRETPSEDAEYTFPKALKAEILGVEPGFKVEPFRQISRTKHFLRHVARQLKCQERVCSYLIRKHPCDFTMSFFAIPDIIQHIFWSCLDPSHPNYERRESGKFLPLIEKCYMALDDIIANRLKSMDENTVLMIMSDHGAGPAHKVFQVNKWLKDEGLLHIKENYDKSYGVSIGFLKKALTGIINAGSRFDVLGLRRLIGFRTRSKRMAFARKNVIDWSMTKAYAGRIGEYGIHINLKGREGEGIVAEGPEYEMLRDRIIKGLSEVRDPETSAKVFRKLWKREELYRGDFVRHAPDLIFDFCDNPYLPGDGLFAKEQFESIPRLGLGGMHRDYGILLAKGKGIKKGVAIDGAHICDLAPTVLFLLDAEIPDDMDGDVLTQLLESVPPDAEIRRRRTREGEEKEKENFIYSASQADEISKRLSDLGYL
ncbi:MAG: alkaline phosphatase family protein [Nitrospirae bacterium]|nr:alkaline phosphatase family protein [Nitrospirota bacterium]